MYIIYCIAILIILLSVYLIIKGQKTNYSSTNLVVGGIYSVRKKKGFGVIKILAIDKDVVHISSFPKHFNKRPTRISSDDLKLEMSIEDLDSPDLNLAIAHLPIERENFYCNEPVFICKKEISKEELEPYKSWQS